MTCQLVHLEFWSSQPCTTKIKWSTPILESVSNIGLLFYQFLVGLELDLRSVRRSGWRASTIAAGRISFRIALDAVMISFIQKIIYFNNDNIGYTQHLMFMGVSLSVTVFPCARPNLSRAQEASSIIDETAMATAAFNDVTAWILFALAIVGSVMTLHDCRLAMRCFCQRFMYYSYCYDTLSYPIPPLECVVDSLEK